jgi:hypothetical protein
LSGSSRRVASAIVCALQLACEPPTDPIPPAAKQLVVQGVLELGGQNPMVSVEWMENGTLPRSEVTGAFVSITTSDGRVMPAIEDVYIYTGGFGNQPRDSALWNGMYRLDLQKNGGILLPGATYTLDVLTPGGQGTHATGKTTIPFMVNAPDDVGLSSFNRLRDTLRLSWKRVPGAKSYQVTVRTFPPQNQAEARSIYTIFTDTSVTIAGTARTFDNDPVFAPGLRAAVVVAAVDDNYYTYFRPTVDPFAGVAPSRLTGALGVFGSIAPVVIRRYDVR